MSCDCNLQLSSQVGHQPACEERPDWERETPQGPAIHTTAESPAYGSLPAASSFPKRIWEP